MVNGNGNLRMFETVLKHLQSKINSAKQCIKLKQFSVYVFYYLLHYEYYVKLT